MLSVKISSLEEIFVCKVDRHFFLADIFKKRAKIKTVFIEQEVGNCKMIKDKTSSLAKHDGADLRAALSIAQLLQHFQLNRPDIFGVFFNFRHISQDS